MIAGHEDIRVFFVWKYMHKIDGKNVKYVPFFLFYLISVSWMCRTPSWLAFASPLFIDQSDEEAIIDSIRTRFAVVDGLGQIFARST